MSGLADGRGRVVRYLRLSVTDRCNFRCLYCHSNARHSFIPHPHILRYEEMARMVGVMYGLGVRKVRLTGGEPFARKGCGDFLVMLRRRFPDIDLRVTSNGSLLAQNLESLRAARVSAVNLSLDSFDRQTFARVTGRDTLPVVLDALSTASERGTPPGAVSRTSMRSSSAAIRPGSCGSAVLPTSRGRPSFPLM